MERDLAKVEAAGSSPVSRSRKKDGNLDVYRVSAFFYFPQNLRTFEDSVFMLI